jgi:hypothetical protein
MPKYTVPIVRTVQDVYVVEARSGTEAGMAAATRIAAGDAPDTSRELSRRVLSAKTVLDDSVEPATA